MYKLREIPWKRICISDNNEIQRRAYKYCCYRYASYRTYFQRLHSMLVNILTGMCRRVVMIFRIEIMAFEVIENIYDQKLLLSMTESDCGRNVKFPTARTNRYSHDWKEKNTFSRTRNKIIDSEITKNFLKNVGVFSNISIDSC